MPNSSAAGAARILTGLIGRNIGGSRSPWLHVQEGRAQGLDLTYELFDFAVQGRTEAQLGAALGELEARGFAGVNITHPYKQAVIAHLGELSLAAERIGAVNTVRFEAGRRIGHNTDVTGFGESLRTGLPGADLSLVLQLGAGGGGAATAQALLDAGTGTLLVHDQDSGRATLLATRLARFYGPERVLAVRDLRASVAGADGIVNATPVGMVSTPGTAIPLEWVSARQWVADIVYFPLETELLRQARAKGCRTLDGSGMAILQAAAAFRIFTGRTADVERMRWSFAAFPPAPVAAEALG